MLLDFRSVKQQLQLIVGEAKNTLRRQASVSSDKKSTVSRNKSIDLTHHLSGEQSKLLKTTISDKELYGLLQGANSYTDVMSIKQTRDKLQYIDRIYKEIQTREQALREKEEQGFFSRLINSQKQIG